MEFLGMSITMFLTVALLACGYMYGKEAGKTEGYIHGFKEATIKQEPVDMSRIATINEELGKGYIDEDVFYARGETSVPKSIAELAREEEDAEFKKIVYGEGDN